MDNDSKPFWSISDTELLGNFKSSLTGLTSDDAKKRIIQYGANRLKPQKRADAFTLLISQFKSPIILILLFATGLSVFLHDPADALIILLIVLVSGLLGFWQEYSASNAVEKLLAIVQINAAVIRDGNQLEISIEDIVPGDIIFLNAGDIVPGD
jgi:Mg2+-importing ATPase